MGNLHLLILEALKRLPLLEEKKYYLETFLRETGNSCHSKQENTTLKNCDAWNIFLKIKSYHYY